MKPPAAAPATRLAFAALLTVAAAGALIVLLRSPERRTVTAEFTDVRGLVVGAQVRVAGVPVGDVQRIWLGRDGWPRVAMSIDSDVSPARAAVRMASLSGEFNRYVSVVQGTYTTFIPRSRTTSPVEVDQALSTFNPATERALRTALSGLQAALSGRGPALAATLRSSEAALAQVTGLARDVGDDGGALNLALRSSAVIASTLSSRSPELGSVVNHSAQLMRTLAGQATAVRNALAGLPTALSAARGTLTRAHAVIAPANLLISGAAPGIKRLPRVSYELQTALQAASPALGHAASAAQVAPQAARSLMPALRQAGPLLRVLIPVLRRIGPMLDQLRVRFPDAFSFFANWADFTSNFDANGHGARVGIVIPPAPDKTLPPNSNGAGQLAPPFLRTPGSLEGQPWTDYWKSFVAGGKR